MTTDGTPAPLRAPLQPDQDSACTCGQTNPNGPHSTDCPAHPITRGNPDARRTLSPYDRIEAMLVGIGARLGRVVGKVSARGQGLELSVWILPGGAPIILQRFHEGGVDVYVQASEDNTIRSVEAAILGRVRSDGITPVVCTSCGSIVPLAPAED